MFHHQRTSGNLTQTLIDSMPYIGNVIVEILLFAFNATAKTKLLLVNSFC